MNRILRFACYGFLILLTGCSSLQSFDAEWLESIFYTPTPAPAKTATARPQATQATQSVTEQAEPAIVKPRILRIWLPPQFNPNTSAASAALLKQRLTNFEAEHPGLEIDVRIKAEEGEADLLNSLSVTSMAAPSALPDLVALPRHALESAAQKGLIRPLDGLSTELENSDWYPYAHDLAEIEGTSYGFPFAGDALVIIYRPELVWIKTWDDILLSESHLVFAGGDPQAQVGLSLYVSAGGELVDAQGQPTLDQEVLTRVLEIFSKGRAAALFPDASANISTDEQVLQEYRARRAEMAIVHISNYRDAQDGLLQPLMGLDEEHLTFATSWVWALAGQNIDNQQLSVELAEFLAADDFLARWINETGYLPTRPSVLNEAEETAIPAVIEAAEPIPSTDVVLTLGPLMQEALVRVLNGEQPEAVARSIVQKLR
jgi:ABC-type glycerol-3-phosphate transport system substrate-binding protein